MNGAALLDHTVERVIAPVDDIVLAAQAGSPAAFAELHSIYAVRLYKTILAITRNPHDAEEALQETFLRAYLAIKTFEGSLIPKRLIDVKRFSSSLGTLFRILRRPTTCASVKPTPCVRFVASIPNCERQFGCG
jgi:hypothetical protein